ncbi:DNA cytosine methyltransferase [Chromobacterium haemolyticum]|uniref:DNA cytosine methyltransferase n=1 Tax=Chromobacterium haemolyticum TaxID=394935 RepID=UPI0009D9B84D|nr:DNA (cytosine-5-)-methyltransferase [Chromobacterium haemolyticum]OQS33000.1 DNA (cytosine-5-)-methyltransferase [Chromobacterium haemolyticum]
MDASAKPTVGSLFAGIGGFDIGFENAGFRTVWQVEINPICRAVLSDRFPHAKQYEDVRAVGAGLERVDVIVGGFPCQDLSTMGKRRGLEGERSGLFYEVCRIATELQPRWLVLENVTGLLSCGHGRDFQEVISTLAECGYVGYWRVLNAQYFGIPTSRRRVFIVAGLREHPPVELLADAAPMGVLPRQEITGQSQKPFPTLLAGSSPSQVDLSGANIVVESNGWRAMADRARASDDHGLCLGLDATNFTEAHAAGNAVAPQIAAWIAGHLIRAM